MFGVPVALNVDGLERKRKKWNRLARGWYGASEWLATFCPTTVVTDARSIQDYYLERYGKSTVFISYGAEVGKAPRVGTLERLGLEPGRYFLYVSRMEPENNPLMVRNVLSKCAPTSVWLWSATRPTRQTSEVKIGRPAHRHAGAIYGENTRLGSGASPAFRDRSGRNIRR
jgi:hypothetical protein